MGRLLRRLERILPLLALLCSAAACIAPPPAEPTAAPRPAAEASPPAAPPSPTPEKGAVEEALLQSDRVRARFTLGKAGAAVEERYEVMDGEGTWRTVFRASPRGPGGERVSLSPAGGRRERFRPRFTRLEKGVDGKGRSRVTLFAETPRFRLEKRVTLEEAEAIFHVEVTVHLLQEGTRFHGCESAYRFVPAPPGGGPPSFTWAPCLRPGKTDLVPDRVFRSPVVMAREGGLLGALLPDLHALARAPGPPHAMDLDTAAPGGTILSFGIVPFARRGHVYWRRLEAGEAPGLEGSPFSYAFHLLLRAGGGPRDGFGAAARLLWRRYGRPALRAGENLPSRPLRDWVREAFDVHAWKDYVPVNLPGLRGGLIRSGRAVGTNDGTADDAWFSARFQSLRVAWGLFLFGKAARREEAAARAERMVDLLLSAPRREGLFPTIFCLAPDGRSGTWYPDSGWDGYPDCYHLFDQCWTGCWLLAFAAQDHAYRERVLEFLSPLADFLVEHQEAGGGIPTFVRASDLAPRAGCLAHFPAETAGAALFLSRMYRATGKAAYLAAARKAAAFVERNAAGPGRWFDFETFLSCSRKPFDFRDPHTGCLPEGTLGLMQAAWAWLDLYRATKERRCLEAGRGILDRLCLYQQVWSPPFFHAALFGGLGVQNTDSQWSDGRTALAAELFLDYYAAAGEREYLERGAAALRAAISMAPHPCWAHRKEDGPDAEEGVLYGTGNAAASAVLARLRFGDAFLRLDEGWAVTFGALRVSGLEVDRSFVRFRLRTPPGAEGEVVLKFGGLRFGVYQVVVNGKNLGTFSASELARGLRISPPAG